MALRNGFVSKDEFENSLYSIEEYYISNKPNFFFYANAIYESILTSRYNTNFRNNIVKQYLDELYKSIDFIRDDGWNFPSWQDKEREKMIKILLYLYDNVEGFNWNNYQNKTSF